MTFHDDLGQGRTLRAAAGPLEAIWGIFYVLSKWIRQPINMVGSRLT